MMTRRDAIRLAVSMPLAPWTAAAQSASTRALASGDPMSPQRRALIDAFRAKIAGVADQFEKRVHKSSWAMPYRLFRPSRAAGAPLVLYLHGSGGVGDDNQKQLGLGNIFAAHVWVLSENQKRFPCYVVAPQRASAMAYGSPSKSFAQLSVSSRLMSDASMRSGNQWVARARGTSSLIIRRHLPRR